LKLSTAQLKAYARKVRSNREKENEKIIKNLSKSPAIIKEAKLVLGRLKEIEKLNKKISDLSNKNPLPLKIHASFRNGDKIQSLKDITKIVAEEKATLHKIPSDWQMSKIEDEILIASIDSKTAEELEKKIL